jgi:lipid II:glycine glycyltransferase (peptidoglycan interpeptide bridge formation enzyme)
MDIRTTTGAAVWDAWLLKQSFSNFTQSSLWARLLVEEDKRVELLQAVDGEVVVAQALVVYTRLPFGWQYAFSPKGPVVASGHIEVYQAFADYFIQKKCLFWRVEPASFEKYFSSYTKVYDVNPSATVLLALGDDDALLSAMHTKTRYNIRLAEKKGVVVKEIKDWAIFWNLMKQTGERDGFRLHDKKHYEHILASSFSRQLVAYIGETPVATGLFIGFGTVFTYVFGASDYAHRQVMAPHLIQWAGMQLAKRLGYSHYDFFGIAPGKYQGGEYIYDEKHQYAGVTRFKMGFGGVSQVAPGTFDLIFSSWQYRLYQILRFVRRFF